MFEEVDAVVGGGGMLVEPAVRVCEVDVREGEVLPAVAIAPYLKHA
jgi:hypothetical protein